MKFFVLYTGLCLLSHIVWSQETDSFDAAAEKATAHAGKVPIQYFSIILKEGGGIQLNWQHATHKTENGFLSIERSTNGGDFEVVGVVKCQDKSDQYEWTDAAPVKGKDFYRIRVTGNDEPPVYSDTVSATVLGDISFTFYPNPVDNALIVRTESPAQLQILDEFGKVQHTQSLGRGPQIINVSFLKKGIYYLRLSNNEGDRPRLERLLKK